MVSTSRSTGSRLPSTLQIELLTRFSQPTGQEPFSYTPQVDYTDEIYSQVTSFAGATRERDHADRRQGRAHRR